MSDKNALTTGEVARHCGVNFRTVIRWIERGHLDAYKLPGRGDNRIPRAEFLRFLEQNRMPVPEALLPHRSELLLLLDSGQIRGDVAAAGRCAGWEPLVVVNELQFGYLLGGHAPAGLIVMDDAIQARIDHLLSGQRETSMLKIRLCHTPEVEKMCAGWHIVSWPSDQQTLVTLLSNACPGNMAEHGEA